MKRWLVRFGLWLARLGGWQPSTPAHIAAYVAGCVREQHHRWPDRDGEAKRAAVYRQLTNAFPKAPKRVLAQAIEEAVCSEC